MGIVNTDGQIWSSQRRFSLTNLKDLGFGKKSLDLTMVEEVDQVIDKLLESENGIVTMHNTFNTAIINVLWQIVASKRFEPDQPDTNKMMTMLNAQFKTGQSIRFFFPSIQKYFPLRLVDHYLIEMKDMMKEIISEHLKDIDYDNPRDFIDIYLNEMQNNANFDHEHLVVICLDFFQAGAETTSTTLLWVRISTAYFFQIILECKKSLHIIHSFKF